MNEQINEMPPQSSLEKAKLAVGEELKRREDEEGKKQMPLRFEVTDPETLEKLFTVKDLTLPTPEGQERNIVGVVYDSVIEKLDEHGFPDINIIRGNPEVDAKDNFDNLLFPPGNPGRSSTYTRYTDEDHVLRTHTSALVPSTFRELDKEIDRMTFVLPGLVHRRDVIDPNHLDVFHQIDVWTLQKNSKHGATSRENLLELAKIVFEAACPGAEMIVLEADHPYTIDGIEVYAKIGDEEIEVFEAGLTHPEILKMAGLDPNKYSGLALGMGVERLIMARKKLPDIRLIRSKDPRIVKQMTDMEIFKKVSDQPAMSRDMSYCVNKNDKEEDVCEAIKNAFGEQSDLVEEVKILEETFLENLHPSAVKKLGPREDQKNVLVRIILRHPDKTLTKEEAAELYSGAYPKLHQGTEEGYPQ